MRVFLLAKEEAPRARPPRNPSPDEALCEGPSDRYAARGRSQGVVQLIDRLSLRERPPAPVAQAEDSGASSPRSAGRDIRPGGRADAEIGRASCRERVCQYV